jgi:hypothetical protein
MDSQVLLLLVSSVILLVVALVGVRRNAAVSRARRSHRRLPA